jgi:hypothetical protein
MLAEQMSGVASPWMKKGEFYLREQDQQLMIFKVVTEKVPIYLRIVSLL